MFWIFWREEIFNFYNVKEPQTPKNVMMRTVNCYVSNIVPPLIMILDFLFSKTLFVYSHMIFTLLVFILFSILRHFSWKPVVYETDWAIFPTEFFTSLTWSGMRQFLVIVGMCIGVLVV